jgi:predicted TIM-barrel fold metal-dependent hydrolase
VIGDDLVVDAVIHPYNLATSNQDPSAQSQLDAVYAAHRLASDPEHAEYVLSHDEFFTDFSYDAIAHALFVESDVDVAVIHALPNLGFCRGHVTDPDRAAAFRDEHPTRFLLYATVDTPIVDSAIAQLERQVRELGVDGLKLYPAFFYDGIGEGWRLDGTDFATPLIEAARDLGIRNVAVHKALWLPPAPREAFAIDDIALPLERFPDINFHIVHAGTAFLEQTRRLLERHRNLYLNLETTFQYALVKPELFAKILGTLITSCGSDRLLFASGCNLMHPHPILEAFRDYSFPEELAAEHGFTPITAEDRRNILGANVLRAHGLQAPAMIEGGAGDVYAQARADGRPAPWSVIREAPGVEAVTR